MKNLKKKIIAKFKESEKNKIIEKFKEDRQIFKDDRINNIIRPAVSIIHEKSFIRHKIIQDDRINNKIKPTVSIF